MCGTHGTTETAYPTWLRTSSAGRGYLGCIRSDVMVDPAGHPRERALVHGLGKRVHGVLRLLAREGRGRLLPANDARVVREPRG